MYTNLERTWTKVCQYRASGSVCTNVNESMSIPCQWYLCVPTWTKVCQYRASGICVYRLDSSENKASGRRGENVSKTLNDIDVDAHDNDYDINNNNDNNSNYSRKLHVTKLIQIQLHDTIIMLQIYLLSEILRQNTNVTATSNAVGIILNNVFWWR